MSRQGVRVMKEKNHKRGLVRPELFRGGGKEGSQKVTLKEGVEASVQAMGVRRVGGRGQGGDPQVDRPTGPQGDGASQRQAEGGAENLIWL